jgi:hypothetical protein
MFGSHQHSRHGLWTVAGRHILRLGENSQGHLANGSQQQVSQRSASLAHRILQHSGTVYILKNQNFAL